MRRGLGVFASLALLTAGVSGQAGLPECDTDDQCQYTTTFKGRTLTFDLRRLCNANADYVMTDNDLHTYYAQICGYAAQPCLPYDWDNEYEYGRVVQMWGGLPACDYSCQEERTGAPVCCTRSCQVIAVRQPTFHTVVPGDPTQGIVLTYLGETPTINDPYQCPWDPETNTYYQRMTHMQFFCDSSVTGFAQLYEVDQNATDGCDYTLKFKTSAVCITGISGGWIFCIIVLTAFTAYALFGSLFLYWRTKTWTFPNSHFWAEFFSLVHDGALFIVCCFKLPHGGKGSRAYGSLGTATGGATADTNPFGGSAAGTSGGGGGGSASSAYQTVGTSTPAGGSGGEVRSSAYTDL